MKGPYNIPDYLKYVRKGEIGAFVLTRNEKTAHLVGRSTELFLELKNFAENSDYKRFWFEKVDSELNAYYLECQWSHKYRPSDNKQHPDVPSGSTWKCPVEGCRFSS